MTDLLYIAVIAGLFLTAWGLLALCDRLQSQKPEERI